MEMEIICGMRILGHEMEVPLQRGNAAEMVKSRCKGEIPLQMGNPAAKGKSRCKGEIHSVKVLG